jgi:hypothetical protein
MFGGLVIRRFAQHYQNFCGFDRIETAQTYLAVFEWCYRLTPSPRTRSGASGARAPSKWPATT